MKGTKLVAVCAVVLAGTASAAIAANDGRADPTLLLGELNTYPTPETALKGCRHDRVVWADRYDGFYYDTGDPKYGVTREGAFACRKDARTARYWSTDPRDSMDGHPGRSFPFQPLFFGS